MSFEREQRERLKELKREAHRLAMWEIPIGRLANFVIKGPFTKTFGKVRQLTSQKGATWLYTLPWGGGARALS